MKKISWMVLGLVAGLTLVSPAMAEGEQGAKHHKFKDADTDGDQKLSQAEFAAGFPRGNTEKRFAAADADGDGFLTRAELKAAHGKKECKAKDKTSE
jgi:hypothetical protein